MPFRIVPRALAASLLAAAGPFLLSAFAQPGPPPPPPPPTG
jgi:hypothetical protein